MKVFNYSQYIKCIHTLRLNAVLQLAEEGAEYNLQGQEKRNAHSRLIKNILNDKQEAQKFINDFVKPKRKIETEELEKYRNKYITKKYKSKEADLIYKIKNKEVFFLIEHQLTIDSAMSYKILNYCIDIMQEWCRNKRLNKTISKNVEYPVVVPIVIYTGDKVWNVPKNFKEKQISNYVFERNKINLEYNLVDINKISDQIFMKQNTIFGYTMLIEKSTTKAQLMDNISFIINQTKSKEKIEKLADILNCLSCDVLDEKIRQEILEKYMNTLYDRLQN